MDSSTSIRTSSLALSLLRRSSLPSESFVLFPISLNSSLSIVHDGASGRTQEELTNLLLCGSSPSDVTDFYSSLTISISSSEDSGVSVKLANKFYIDANVKIQSEYQKHIVDKYGVKVENIDLSLKEQAATEINKFVESATMGKIKSIIEPKDVEKALAIMINATHILAKWKHPFSPSKTFKNKFHAEKEDEELPFMSQNNNFQVNQNNEIGTVLILPYQDEKYSFFFLMPNESSNLETMRKALTGEALITVLNGAEELYCRIRVPKFKVQSKLDGVDILKKLGVSKVFSNEAELCKISTTPLHVTQITHSSMIEIDELGTEAAAVSVVVMYPQCGFDPRRPPVIEIDRPFLFGIRRGDDILFIGQFTGK